MQEATIEGQSFGQGIRSTHTTLYDLVSAVREVVGLENDDLVTQTVAEMMKAGYFKAPRNST
jgi:hypothetical protein